MNNQQKKLFNIACKIEKLLYEHCGIKNFNKEVNFFNLIINTGKKELTWEFIEAFTDLIKKENINSLIFTDDHSQIKIWS